MDFSNTLSWPDGTKVLFDHGGKVYKGEIWNADGENVFLLHNLGIYGGSTPDDRRGFNYGWRIGGPGCSSSDKYNFWSWDMKSSPRFSNLRPESGYLGPGNKRRLLLL